MTYKSVAVLLDQLTKSHGELLPSLGICLQASSINFLHVHYNLLLPSNYLTNRNKAGRPMNSPWMVLYILNYTQTPPNMAAMTKTRKLCNGSKELYVL